MNAQLRLPFGSSSTDPTEGWTTVRLSHGAPAFGVRRFFAALAAACRKGRRSRTGLGIPLDSADQSAHSKRFATHSDFGRYGILLGLCAICGSTLPAASPANLPAKVFDEDMSTYRRVDSADMITQLQREIDHNGLALGFDPQFGFLPSLLEKLNISPASQTLVCSKTSLQQERISPRTPRAIFFSDSVYVTWIPGSPILEISSVDPRIGAVFYTLEQKALPRPRFVRNDDCLQCHTSGKTMGVPGYVIRSCVTDENGRVDPRQGAFQVTHRTPIAERWSGWYVTGRQPVPNHLGNLFGESDFERRRAEPGYRVDLADVTAFVNAARYPRSTSDFVALMILDHQVHMQNLMTRLSFESAEALEETGQVHRAKAAANAFLKYLLFVEEAKVPAPVACSEEFAKWFQDQGPKDRQGRSLRQFDLQTRLFKYPCSYLIYSETFDQIPRDMKLYIYRRLWKILRGEDTTPEFQTLSTETKRDILEILKETKRGLPVYWTLSD
ncbi:MAG: hypothetical protein HY735_21570 [Verrucomicrobia bacterium]|nr:hypothetical protein [Verrucomicrobiota bacterium]